MDQIEKFVKDSGLTIPAYNVCFYDSNGTDEILDNIFCGKKRANTGLFSLFEAQMQLLPRTGLIPAFCAIFRRSGEAMTQMPVAGRTYRQITVTGIRSRR